jgi:hypothetical protein
MYIGSGDRWQQKLRVPSDVKSKWLDILTALGPAIRKPVLTERVSTCIAVIYATNLVLGHGRFIYSALGNIDLEARPLRFRCAAGIDQTTSCPSLLFRGKARQYKATTAPLASLLSQFRPI